jgi:predicted Zn finger-like uncharacterized protein
MIVTCPACSTRYLVDPQALGSAGRVVRCANCSKTWHQTPPEDFPRSLDLAPADAEPVLGAGRVQLPALPRRRGIPWAMVAGIALLVILVSGAAAGILARDQVVALWPPAARLYIMAGLPVAPSGAGLQLRKTTPVFTTENGVRTLVIEGEVANITQGAREVPALRVVLRDRDGAELQSLSVTLVEQHLLPGASVPFRTSIPQPNPAATSVLVTIGDGG